MQDGHTLCFSWFGMVMIFSGAAGRPVEHPWPLRDAISDFFLLFWVHVCVVICSVGIAELTQVVVRQLVS